MNRKFIRYYLLGIKNHIGYRLQIARFKRATDPLLKEKNAQILIGQAIDKGTGYYTCAEVERYYLERAKAIPIDDYNIEAESNSFLHVMTQAGSVGGHSRVVERWINSAESTQTQSLVLLGQGDISIPEHLQEVVEGRKGSIYNFSRYNTIEKAKRLRELSLHFECIILHIHMYDFTAIMAYGIEEFKRPIILFNHADHLYWCGSSIVDMVADLRDNDWCEKYRNVQNHYTLRIPVENNVLFQNYPKTKEESRSALGIPLDEKMILTVGSSNKYDALSSTYKCNFY